MPTNSGGHFHISPSHFSILAIKAGTEENTSRSSETTRTAGVTAS